MALQIALPAAETGFEGLRAKLSTFVARRAAYRTAFNELERLSNRELADIGITRSDIPAIARQAAAAI